MAQRFHVNAARGDVRGDEHLIGAILEAGQGLRPLRLRAIAVDAFGLDAVGDQLRREPVGAVLRAGEDQRLRHVSALEQLHQQGALQILRHRIHGLRDALGRRRLALEVERHRLVQHLLRERGDRGRHGRTEKQRLALLRGKMAQDFLDFRQEAHVQHAVGFIQHQEFQLIELGVRLAEVVQQASGRGDQHIGAAAERVLLRSHADAAEDGGRGQGGVNGDIAEALIDLRRQLAGGRQHERAR